MISGVDPKPTIESRLPSTTRQISQMHREKFLLKLLAVIVIVPATFWLISGSLNRDDQSKPLPSPAAEMVWVDSSSDWPVWWGETVYVGTILIVSISLLQVTQTIERRWKWIWFVFLVLLPPFAAFSLVLRVYRGSPSPRTIEEQRQLIRAKADEIRAQRSGR